MMHAQRRFSLSLLAAFGLLLACSQPPLPQSWDLVAIRGERNLSANLQLKLNEGFNGNDGCNHIFGGLQPSPALKNSQLEGGIKLGPLASTLMACIDNDAERSAKIARGAAQRRLISEQFVHVTRYRISNDRRTLILMDEDGQALLEFRNAEAKAADAKPLPKLNFPEGAPLGSWRQTCDFVSLKENTQKGDAQAANAKKENAPRENIITARCRRLDGEWLESSLTYAPKECAALENLNGQLACLAPPDAAPERTPKPQKILTPEEQALINAPGGTWRYSCDLITVRNNKITARCRRNDGSWNEQTQFDLSSKKDCPAMENNDGQLSCYRIEDARQHRSPL